MASLRQQRISDDALVIGVLLYASFADFSNSSRSLRISATSLGFRSASRQGSRSCGCVLPQHYVLKGKQAHRQSVSQ